jgi:protoheme ferro-lyase
MEIISWVVIAGVSLLVGICLVEYLTVHPLQMSWYLLLVCLFTFGIVLLLMLNFTGWQRLFALGASLIFALAGYWGMTWWLHRLKESEPLPVLKRATSDPGAGHIAVIYLAHGEPETYDPVGWLHTFNEFDESGVRFIPYLLRPYFLYELRRKYLAVGKSEHKQMHHKMMTSLEQAFRREGDSCTRFYLSFLDDTPRPDAAAIQALNEGACCLVIAEVFVTNSNHTAEGEALIQRLNPEDFGVSVKFSGPLWDSPTLARMFVQRVNERVGEIPKSKVGILLVGHGQPLEWDHLWLSETEQETNFRQSIKALFEEQGFPHDNIGLAWMEFRKPTPGEEVLRLVEKEVEKIFYFSASISADSIHSQCDIPNMVEAAQIPSTIEVINLGAWNDHPLVIEAIKEKIQAAIAA